MSYLHKILASGRWHTLSLAEQMGNLGSEFERFSGWKKKGEIRHSQASAERFLELLDLTISDPRWRERLGELARLREIFCGLYLSVNIYDVSYQDLGEYFLQFGILARK